MSAPLKLKAVYQHLKNQLSACEGIHTPDLDARLILEKRAGIEWSDLIAKPDYIILEDAYDLICEDLKLRLDGTPLSRVYKEREFWGLSFEINDDTLDPRPDTELIIDIALKRFSSKAPETILDLGTGSGCLLVSLLCEFHESNGIGVDISKGALRAARNNAAHNDCGSRAQFLNGSWFDPIDTTFDLIVSNPPYISNQIIPTLAKEVRNHDPILALDGGMDGLDPYKILFSQLKTYLNPGGIALFEIGYDQKDDVMRLSEKHGFALRTVHVDLAGNPRVVEISCGDK